MLNKFSEALRRYASGWLVLVFFAGELIFNAFILPAQQAKLKTTSGGVGPIDIQFFYMPDEVYAMVAAYGEAGRREYRAFELSGDLVYPVVYTLFFALLITLLFQRGFAPNSSMQKLNVLPFGAWLFDLFENLGIATMLSVYPSTPALLAWGTALCTLMKWLFVGAAILLLLGGMVMVLTSQFKKRAMKFSQNMTAQKRGGPYR